MRCLAETERGVDQRIRSREVEVISGDPGVNEGSSKDALTRQQAATSKKGPSTRLLKGPTGRRSRRISLDHGRRIKRKYDATDITEAEKERDGRT